VQRVLLTFAIDGNSRHPKRPRRPDDAYGNLTPVRHEQRGD
jgi:hypothetical protein